MKKTLSQNIWLSRQKKDKYFHLSKKEGFRSRAAYKLIEIESKYKVIKKKQNIVDLGSAPGSWSQALLKILENKSSSKILAIDINDMKPIKNIIFLKKDIKNILEEESFLLPIDNIGLVLSDMAPSATGHKFTDQTRSEELCCLALEFACKNLERTGNCILKILRGNREQAIKLAARKLFKKVEIFKPISSRKESKEIYLICMSFNNLHTEKIPLLF